MEKSESRQWVTKVRGLCKYQNPKYLFTVFMQLLLEEEPFFWKMKTYDTVTVSTTFGRETLRDVDMPIRDFVIDFHRCCLPLMKLVWPDVDEINKIPIIPRIICNGYTEKAVEMLDRKQDHVRAQYARTHRLELHQQWVERIESAVEVFRDSFNVKLNHARVNSCRATRSTLTI